MYNPAAFAERRPEVLEEAVREYPLATLVTVDRGGRIEASLLPLVIETREDGAKILCGHMARANPQWSNCDDGCQALAIFHGPQHYISPSWYASKAEHGRVVPTWNYVTVQARGRLRFQHDAEWLRRNVTALTRQQEARREDPWAVGDAPPEFIDGQLRAIVGVELEISEFEGKWKVSQNRNLADRESTAKALEADPDTESLEMARLIRAALKTGD